MIACVLNALLILLGSAVGLFFNKKLPEALCTTLMRGLSICVVVIGMTYAVQTANIIIVVVSVALGGAAGELLKIENGVDRLGRRLKDSVLRGRRDDRFSEGFVTATLIFCVGSMAVIGSVEAGISGNYSIILSKAVIDCVAAMTFAATLGVGVLFSAFSVLIYQGALTLFAIWLGDFIPAALLNEVTAVGGILLIGVGLNTMGILGAERIRVANLLPAMLVPAIYLPIAAWIGVFF